MRIGKRDERWLREEIPLPLPREEVAELWKEFVRRREGNMMTSFLFTGFLAFLAIITTVALAAGFNWPGQGWYVAPIFLTTATTITYLYMVIAHRLVFRARFERLLRTILRERGHEVCVPCGYCLAGLSDDVTKCPECGAAREPMPAGDAVKAEP